MLTKQQAVPLVKQSFRCKDTIFILGLEPAPILSHNAPSPFLPRVLDWITTFFQLWDNNPKHIITHTELFIIGSNNENKKTNFAIYKDMGGSASRASWGDRFSFSESFNYYTQDNIHRWRAIPIHGHDLARRTRECIDAAHIDTQYSTPSYLFSCPPLRAFAGLRNPKASAHCASLSARIIQNVLTEESSDRTFFNKHVAAWYNPTTLCQVARKKWRANTFETKSDRTKFDYLFNTVHIENVTQEDCDAAIGYACNAIRCAENDEDIRIAEQNLAKVLLKTKFRSFVNVKRTPS